MLKDLKFQKSNKNYRFSNNFCAVISFKLSNDGIEIQYIEQKQILVIYIDKNQL